MAGRRIDISAEEDQSTQVRFDDPVEIFPNGLLILKLIPSERCTKKRSRLFHKVLDHDPPLCDRTGCRKNRFVG